MIEANLLNSKLQLRIKLIKSGYSKPEVARLIKQYGEWIDSSDWVIPGWQACCDGWEAMVTDDGEVKQRKL